MAPSQNMGTKKKRTRCPNGTRKNKKTGLCEKNKGVELPNNNINVEGAPAPPPPPPAPPVPAPPVPAPAPAPAPAPTPAPTPAPPPPDITKAEINNTEEVKNETGFLSTIRNTIQNTLLPNQEPTIPEVEEPPTVAPEPTVAPPQENFNEDDEESKREIDEYNSLNTKSDEFSFLYPTLDDPNFNVKIAEKKEFYDTRYDGKIFDIEEHAKKLCDADFELAPHQLFVRNFLSFQTPYNSLLLYHGLGSGKTCSAIGVSEEMRDYHKQMGITNRIIVVAAPNVQDNFKLQLFDERKLSLIDGLWNITACVGNKLIKEINPMSMRGLDKESVVRQIKKIIKKSYLFLGYIEFANYIKKSSNIEANIRDSEKKSQLVKKKLKQLFNNRLIVIDEIHNIRMTDDNENKLVATELTKLVKSIDNLKLLMLSATPMYNSYKEIIWLINIMNINDNRPEMDIKDVFKPDGTFVTDENGNETGQALLERKATGYVSYVRGDNPYTFPYRMWPETFSPENTFSQNIKPDKQLNGSKIIEPLGIIDVFLSKIGDYQQTGYDYIIEQIRTKANRNDKPREPDYNEGVEETKGSEPDSPIVGGATVREDDGTREDNSEEVEKPDEKLEEVDVENRIDETDPINLNEPEESEPEPDEPEPDEPDELDEPEVSEPEPEESVPDEPDESEPDEPDEPEPEPEVSEPDVQMPTFDNMEKFGYQMLLKPLEALIMVYPHKDLGNENKNISGIVGKEGLNRVMTHTLSNKFRYKFNYKKETLKDYGRIFSRSEIGKYSGKISSICESIMKSTGVVLIYSQYIDGGIIPMALALEELGLTRASGMKSLFETPPTEKIDATTMKPNDEASGDVFNPAKYVMITGDKTISPDNVADLKAATNLDNVNGEKVKVILISLAGAEGLDFKFIRQVHVVEPWYNMNRIEQIIGRAVRTCSHKNLEFVDRNVEIYLHGSLMKDRSEEAADLYVYRVAEVKAIIMGRVSRVIKSIAVDCLLNSEQQNFSQESMRENGNEIIVKQNLSSKDSSIEYSVGDKPLTAICDYMDKCMYKCKTKTEGYKLLDNNTNMGSYRKEFINVNTDRIIKRVKVLMKNRFFYKKAEMISEINAVRDYPLIQIFAALNQMVEDKSEYITDKYNRIGNLINIGDLYLFQPLEIKNKKASIYERSTPIEYKRPVIKIDLKNRQDVFLKKTDDEIMDEVAENYDMVMNNRDIISGETNWYALAGPVIYEIKKSNKFTETDIDNAIIGHIIDKLESENTLKILNFIQRNKDVGLNDFYTKVNRYLEKLTIKNDKITAFYLHNKGERELYKLNSGEWVKGENTDQEKIKDEITVTINKVKKINDHFAFMSYDARSKTNEFKIKNENDKKSKGYRCQQKPKKYVVAMFKDVMGVEDYNLFKGSLEKSNYGIKKLDSTSFNGIQICVLLEMFFRIYNEQAKNDKVWFLNPLEYIIKQKMSKQKK